MQPADTSTSPISKKEACEILNISYNTTRLQKIIDEHLEHQQYVAKRRAQNRGKPAENFEIAEAVTSYLRGESVTEIAKRLYRPVTFVKGIIERVGVPQRPATAEERMSLDYIPEECVTDSFSIGDVVWSAKYHTTAVIEKELDVDYQAEQAGFSDVNYERKYSSKCYRIFVLQKKDDDSEHFFHRVGDSGFFAYALAYDLGKLTHLEQYGINLRKI